METNLKVRSGNRTVIMIDGIDVGLIQNLRANEDFGHEPASGIGDAKVVEYVPGQARFNLSISKMVLLKELMRSAGITPGSTADVLKGRVIDIVAYGLDENDVLKKWTKCTYTGGSVEIQAHRIVTTDAQFNAIDSTGTGI